MNSPIIDHNQRVSSLLALEELKKSKDMQEMLQRVEQQKSLDVLRTRATEILSVLSLYPEFCQLFLVQSLEDMSAFVFSHRSDRIIVLDMLARCPRDQVANFETYKFASHPEFEKKISLYTRTAEKPNNQLAKCRSWDVALCLALKIEALDSETMALPCKKLLFREHLIFKHMWDFYMRENLELDEMTGIPIVFRYEEIPNATFNCDTGEHKVYDMFGNWVTWKSESKSTLSYMCMEQLGPTLQYTIDVMQGSKRRSCMFDFDTAFKIFDQLLCRCMQTHRFTVVHNAIEPSNLYFGRNISFNVLYIANFGVATVFDPRDPNNMRKSGTDSELYGSPRFASMKRLAGAQPHPVHDLESAFYTLVAMLTNNLPWDPCLAGGGASSKVESRGPSILLHEANKSNAASRMSGTALVKAAERNGLMQQLREHKANFWRSSGGIARVLADLQYMTIGADKSRVPLAAEILMDLYGKIRDLLHTVGSEQVAANFYNNLLLPHTAEYQIYTDLRRAVLMLYRFESISVFINTPTYQKKIESLAHDDPDASVRLAWNLTNWCFNSVGLDCGPSSRVSCVRSMNRQLARTAD